MLFVRRPGGCFRHRVWAKVSFRQGCLRRDAHTKVRQGELTEPPPDRNGSSHRIMASLEWMTLEGGIDPGAAGWPPFFFCVRLMPPALSPRVRHLSRRPQHTPQAGTGPAVRARHGKRIEQWKPLAMAGEQRVGKFPRGIGGERKNADACVSAQGIAACPVCRPNPQRRAAHPFSR